MSSSFFGPLSAFLSSATWAYGSARYSQLTGSYSAFSVNFARAIFALPLFLLVSLLVGGRDSYEALRGSHFGWFALSMLASYGLGDVLFFWSTRLIGVPVALAIASCYPLWTAGAGVVFRGERLAPGQSVGLLLAVAGVILVILNRPRLQANAFDEEFRRKVPPAAGVLLALLTSAMWALNSYSVAQGGRDLAVPVANVVRMGFALCYSTAFAWLFARERPLLLPFSEFRRCFWVFVLEAFGGSYLYMYGLTHTPLAVGATLSSLAPVIAVPVAWALGLERIAFLRTVAICMVAAGVSLLVGTSS